MRKSLHTILVICEGKNTEPYIFNSLRDEIMDGIYDIGDVKITIRPEPIIIEDDELPSSHHKYKRVKVKTRSAIVGDEPSEIKAPLPLKWVLEGQKELEDFTYNEVWAVFDHDNFPARKEAFEEAEKEINGQKVNIAFSSICFEYYVLLHFEKLYKVFATSECRYKNDKGKYKKIECSSGVHENDCFGNRCIGGYARKNKLWNNSKTNESLYPIIKDKLEIGFVNSSWLRYSSELKESHIPIFDRNPYITTDKIIKRLIGKENINWDWIRYNQEYCLDKIKIILHGKLLLRIENISLQTIIILNDSLCKVLKDNAKKSFGEKFILEPGQKKDVLIEVVDYETIDYFIFEFENHRILFENISVDKNLTEIASSLNLLTHIELTKLKDLINKNK